MKEETKWKWELIYIPLIIWFFSFVLMCYKLDARDTDRNNDIQEIKSDVKYVKNYLMEHK